MKKTYINPITEIQTVYSGVICRSYVDTKDDISGGGNDVIN